MRALASGFAAAAAIATPALAAPDIAALAAAYGARPQASQMQMSPDGDKVVYLTPSGTAGTAAVVADIATGKTNILLTSKGDTFQLRYCYWKSEARVLCLVSGITISGKDNWGYSRMLSMAPDGSGLVNLNGGSGELKFAASPGRVVDYLPDDPDHVLMQITRESAGRTVELVDVKTAKLRPYQKAQSTTMAFGSDNHGNIRYRMLGSLDIDNYTRDAVTHMVRAQGSQDWHTIGRGKMSGVGEFDFEGFDESGAEAFVTKPLDGRQALYRMALDGQMGTTLVFAHPKVDVDGLLRIGKYSRPVAATYTLDKAEYSYFDATLEKRHTALSKALPGNPPVDILDESWDGTRDLIFAGGETDPGAFYRFDTRTKQLGELLKVRPEVAAFPPAPQRAITYTAADGTVIPGFITMPPGATGKNLPAIVMPHGGPSSRDTLGFDWLTQFYAQLGYVVLQPNYRGSTGYGAAFYKQNGFKSWKTSIGDVNDGARWLAKSGIADPKRLFIVGWSYGGYAALQAAVVDPKLYKAVVAIAPVTDLSLLTKDARYSGNFDTIRAEFQGGDDPVAGSPARNAARIEAPVLMFQGEKDLNVEPAHATVMDKALTAAGKKHELVMIPNLDHQLADSKVRADMLAKSAGWLAAADAK